MISCYIINYISEIHHIEYILLRERRISIMKNRITKLTALLLSVVLLNLTGTISLLQPGAPDASCCSVSSISTHAAPLTEEDAATGAN